MTFRPLQPLLADDESGELAIDVYSPWCYPENVYLMIAPSTYMVLSSIIELFEDGELTAEQAKLCESAFVLNSWTWADQPKRNLPTLQTMLVRSLLLKNGDDEEEEDDDE